MARPKQIDNKTEAKILNSAKELFLKSGFSGTSVGHIAKLAGVNKSLIYHYFTSKEALWKATKEKIASNVLNQPIDQIEWDTSSLHNLLHQYITYKFEIYSKNPDIVRLISWQNIEEQASNLQGINTNALVDNDIKTIKELQETGKIRPELDPFMVYYLLNSMAFCAFRDRMNFVSSLNTRNQYFTFILEFLERALSSSK